MMKNGKSVTPRSLINQRKAIESRRKTPVGVNDENRRPPVGVNRTPSVKTPTATPLSRRTPTATPRSGHAKTPTRTVLFEFSDNVTVGGGSAAKVTSQVSVTRSSKVEYDRNTPAASAKPTPDPASTPFNRSRSASCLNQLNKFRMRRSLSEIQLDPPGGKTSTGSNQGQQDGETSRIVVAVRLRPVQYREHGNTVIVENGKEVRVACDLGTEVKFSYDYAFNPTVSQAEVFSSVVQPLLDTAFQGYNACLFAYGQTGSGKTYSMMGPDTEVVDVTETSGVIPRFCQELMSKCSSSSDPDDAVHTNTTVEVSYLEVYNEKIRDLLVGDGPLRLREHPVHGPYVADLSRHTVTSFEQIQRWLTEGNKKRAVASTEMNDKSSRSHSLFIVTLTQSTIESDESGGWSLEQTRRSQINLVDLAGSERIPHSVTSDRLREGVSINKSLLTLGKVISALVEQRSFVPYRESVLTWLLKESLGGNSRTAMLATVSPCSSHLDETLATLRYASQARAIVNTVRVNESPQDKIIRELHAEVTKLKEAQGRSSTVLDDISQLSSEGDVGKLKEELDYLKGKVSKLKCALESEKKRKLEDVESRLTEREKELSEEWSKKMEEQRKDMDDWRNKINNEWAETLSSKEKEMMDWKDMALEEWADRLASKEREIEVAKKESERVAAEVQELKAIKHKTSELEQKLALNEASSKQQSDKQTQLEFDLISWKTKAQELECKATARESEMDKLQKEFSDKLDRSKREADDWRERALRLERVQREDSAERLAAIESIWKERVNLLEEEVKEWKERLVLREGKKEDLKNAAKESAEQLQKYKEAVVVYMNERDLWIEKAKGFEQQVTSWKEKVKKSEEDICKYSNQVEESVGQCNFWKQKAEEYESNISTLRSVVDRLNMKLEQQQKEIEKHEADYWKEIANDLAKEKDSLEKKILEMSEVGSNVDKPEGCCASAQTSCSEISVDSSSEPSLSNHYLNQSSLCLTSGGSLPHFTAGNVTVAINSTTQIINNEGSNETEENSQVDEARIREELSRLKAKLTSLLKTINILRQTAAKNDEQKNTEINELKHEKMKLEQTLDDVLDAAKKTQDELLDLTRVNGENESELSVLRALEKKFTEVVKAKSTNPIPSTVTEQDSSLSLDNSSERNVSSPVKAMSAQCNSSQTDRYLLQAQRLQVKLKQKSALIVKMRNHNNALQRQLQLSKTKYTQLKTRLHHQTEKRLKINSLDERAEISLERRQNKEKDEACVNELVQKNKDLMRTIRDKDRRLTELHDQLIKVELTLDKQNTLRFNQLQRLHDEKAKEKEENEKRDQVTVENIRLKTELELASEKLERKLKKVENLKKKVDSLETILISTMRQSNEKKTYAAISQEYAKVFDCMMEYSYDFHWEFLLKKARNYAQKYGIPYEFERLPEDGVTARVNHLVLSAKAHWFRIDFEDWFKLIDSEQCWIRKMDESIVWEVDLKSYLSVEDNIVVKSDLKCEVSNQDQVAVQQCLCCQTGYVCPEAWRMSALSRHSSNLVEDSRCLLAHLKDVPSMSPETIEVARLVDSFASQLKDALKQAPSHPLS